MRVRFARLVRYFFVIYRYLLKDQIDNPINAISWIALCKNLYKLDRRVDLILKSFSDNIKSMRY